MVNEKTHSPFTIINSPFTIRTLRYYEEVGLLAPAQRTDAGHRLYGADEVIRLQKVVLLRQHGFSLEEIRVREILHTGAVEPA